MHINENTKISKIISNTPASIDAIVSLSKHFEKLRIPILRKTLASRVTIKQAAKIGGVSVNDFFEKLSPLGFTYDLASNDNLNLKQNEVNMQVSQLFHENVQDLDVRGLLKQNIDPFNVIMEALEKLPEGNALNIINTFEPIPLINILSKKGYSHYTVQKDKLLTYTYFKKEKQFDNDIRDGILNTTHSELNCILEKYKSNIKQIDVRNLEMPLPMSTILNELSVLPNNYLLFVQHKKVPKFLFPELSERGYQWYIQEITEDDVKLYIFK